MSANLIWDVARKMRLPDAVQALLNVAANMALNNSSPKGGLNKRILLSMMETAIVTAEEQAEMRKQAETKGGTP
jgi:hypothetical protein